MENTNPNITARTKKVTNKMSDIAGLHLCEGCRKVNEERIKTLTNYGEERLLVAIKQLEEKMANEVRCLTQMMEKVTFREEMLKEQMREQTNLKNSLNEVKNQVAKEEEMTKKWNEVVKGNFESLTTNVKEIHSSVLDTKNHLDVANERNIRRNNLVIFNIPENESFSWKADKKKVLQLLKEITDENLEKEVSNVFRLGKRVNDQKPRPILIKLLNLTTKNLILENCFKLRRSKSFNGVYINHDLIKLDRDICKQLLDDKKKKIAEKDDINNWIFKIKGQPELNLFLDASDLKYDLIVINEVNPKNVKNSSWNINEFNLPGYSYLVSNFCKASYRGIMLYYKINLQLFSVQLDSIFDEYLCARINVRDQNLNLMIIYRSPNSSNDNNDNLIGVLNEFGDLSGRHLVLGDFNFPDIDWKLRVCAGSDYKIENRFLQLIDDRFWLQHVNEPTRYGTNSCPHVLDLIITSEDCVSDLQYSSPLGRNTVKYKLQIRVVQVETPEGHHETDGLLEMSVWIF
ncbi:hypothetical protein HELRODRAFT_165358 [Helobdella robusta]|uniref:Endonuclease/exonuclease/phosphatase domain-containing protein n=1 Tax=Helobdella robusta TaxID=6412 RepID=T1EWM8_HELRO|nr:hypothetical protein HELRODRAFT_165358 [Helobdella robusta]ESN91336.1 hypothetical protein HELRODRAFT_165358 [Helobdella robusta]